MAFPKRKMPAPSSMPQPNGMSMMGGIPSQNAQDQSMGGDAQAMQGEAGSDMSSAMEGAMPPTSMPQPKLPSRPAGRKLPHENKAINHRAYKSPKGQNYKGKKF